ncbi:unnamed protein product [Thelazia callipaeda]|uniref:Sister chromatid cohesion protein PDS5 homolog B n=1 Tax=Thelazia callipaeda TaxID=103827 RepID=A0A0N5DAH5_THECL|nr:unnamed protein product [Thelazia callipaeda]
MSSTSVEYPPDCKPVNVNCSNTELLKRLKILSEALKNEIANKENGIPNRFTDLMLHLTKSQFISNKNKDVKLLLGCCIADIFRMFAPSTPIQDLSRLKACYNYKLLNFFRCKDVLLLFTTVIGNPPDKKTAMYQCYLYFIEAKTMQLALRLDDDAYIILHNLIKKSFNSMNEKNADEHIQGMMVGMCSKLIQKVDQISNIILDAIFFFIVQPQKINNRESYRMARDLIRTNQMTLEPYIAVLLKRGLETGVLDDCELISRKKLFDLICELGRFAPEIISSVFPSLIKQLHSDVVTARREAARLFGSLFGDQNSHLAEDEPDVWDKYMKRFADVDTEIRRICVKDAENILVFHPGLRGEVTDAVILRSQDVDENVRLEVITMVQRLTKRKFEAISERLLTHVIDRIRDKKAKIVLINMIRVRHTAIRGLSQLHRTVFTDDSLTVLERSSVSSIFSSIMNHYFQPIPGDRALEQILAKQSFQKRLLHDLVVLIDLNDNGQKSEAIDDIVKRIVECNPDPAKFSLSFRHFMTALSNDKQMMLFMKYITGDDYTCKKVEAAVFEILQRLQKHKVSSECIDSIKCLFECCSPLQFDQIAVSFLIHRVVALIKTSVDSNELSQYSKLIKLLKIVADAYAHCFVNQCALENLVKLMDIENFPGIEDFLSLTITISAELRKSEFLDKNIVATFVKYCESIVFDCSPRAAKYAVRCISKLLDTERARVILGNIFQKTVLRVSTSNPNCCTALETLNACVEVNPMQFCSELHEILKSKVMEILFDIEDCGNDIDQDSSEQLNDEVALNNNYVKIKCKSQTGLQYKHCKIQIHEFGAFQKQCLKFIAKFLVSVANFSTCDVDPAAKHILQFYSSLLKNKGNIFKKQCGQNHMAELRLVAGNSMLKLATKPRYAKFFSISDFLSLSTLAYDQVCEIRRRFFAKLNKHLITLHLHVEYMGLFALVGLDDDEGFKNKIRVFINANITKRRKYMERWSTEGVALCYQPEYCLAYAVYVLSKLPTFESIECESELRRLSKYALYF